MLMTLLGLFITWYSHSIEKTDNVSGGLEMFQNSILFTAGQFARLHHLNKRTLHYYDDIGLFSPAYKGRNGYRYYTYQQSGELESILALRELNMSIGEIKEYLNRPTAQRFIELSEKKVGEIEETIQNLETLRNVLKKKQEMLRLSMEVRDGQIDLIHCEEEYLFITPLSSQVQQGEFADMSTLLEHLQKAWDLSKYKTSCGSLLSAEKIRHGEFQIYDGLYTQLESPAEVEGFYRKPPGTYLRGISIGSWEKLPGLYSRMLEFAQKHSYRLTGYAYEIGMNEIAVSDMEHYITQVTILTEENTDKI